MIDYGRLYRECRERIIALVRDASEEQRARVVPACPGWSVIDTVAHLSGVAVEVASGQLSDIPTDDKTAAQVTQRRGLPLEEVIAEWECAGELAEQAVATRAVSLAMVHDVLHHEADIRGALHAGRPPVPAWTASLMVMLGHLDHLAHSGTLTICADEHCVTVGSGAPVTTLTVDPYEFWRAVVGRRSHAQMAAWRWSGDPAPYLPAIPVFGPTEAELTETDHPETGGTELGLTVDSTRK